MQKRPKLRNYDNKRDSFPRLLRMEGRDGPSGVLRPSKKVRRDEATGETPEVKEPRGDADEVSTARTMTPIFVGILSSLVTDEDCASLFHFHLNDLKKLSQQNLSLNLLNLLNEEWLIVRLCRLVHADEQGYRVLEEQLSLGRVPGEYAHSLTNHELRSSSVVSVPKVGVRCYVADAVVRHSVSQC